jgi:hypothetical protein
MLNLVADYQEIDKKLAGIVEKENETASLVLQ